MNRVRTARLLRWCVVLCAWLAGSPLFAQSLPFWLAPGKPSPDATLPYIFDYQPTLPITHEPWTWADADYLLMWLKGEQVPALVTTGPATSVGPSGAPGAPGAAGTSVVLGGNTVNNGVSNGGRFRFGFWLIDDQWFGIECSTFFLLQQRTDATVSSSGSPALSIPYFNVISGTPDSTSIATTAGGRSISGVANLTVQTRIINIDPNFVFLLCDKPFCRLELLAGFRWFKLDDTLQLLTDSSIAPPSALNYFATQDRFQVHNNFYGAQLGLRNEWCWQRWLLNVTGKVAVGDCQQTTIATGGTATNFLTGGTGLDTFSGGYLVLPSNGNSSRRDAVTALTEVSIKGGYTVAKCCKLFVGYNILTLGSVARAAQQIDPEVNPTQGGAYSIITPVAQVSNGLAFPAYHGNSGPFWAQGVTFGVEFRY